MPTCIGKIHPTLGNSKIKQMLGRSHKEFKETIVNMPQQAVTDIVKTNVKWKVPVKTWDTKRRDMET